MNVFFSVYLTYLRDLPLEGTVLHRLYGRERDGEGEKGTLSRNGWEREW